MERLAGRSEKLQRRIEDSRKKKLHCDVCKTTGRVGSARIAVNENDACEEVSGRTGLTAEARVGEQVKVVQSEL